MQHKLAKLIRENRIDVFGRRGIRYDGSRLGKETTTDHDISDGVSRLSAS